LKFHGFKEKDNKTVIKARDKDKKLKINEFIQKFTLFHRSSTTGRTA
jgi:hypothetical protein